MPTLNYQEARASGLSDAQIQAFLEAERRAGRDVRLIGTGEAPLGTAPAAITRPPLTGPLRQGAELLPVILGTAGALIPHPVVRILGMLAGGMTGEIGREAALGTLPKTVGEAAPRVLGAGIEQGVLGTLGGTPRVAGEVLLGFAAKGRQRYLSKAAQQARAGLELGVKASEEAIPRRVAAIAEHTAVLERAVERVAQRRIRAAEQTVAEIAGTPGRMTVGEMAQGAIARAEKLRRGRLSRPEQLEKVREVRARINEVMEAYGLGGFQPRTVYSLEDAQVIKQAFDTLERTAHEQAARGIRIVPDLDKTIVETLRRGIEQRVPTVSQLNRVTQAAIREERVLRSRLARRPPSAATALERERERVAMLEASLPTEAMLREQILNRLARPGREGLIDIVPGLPVSLGVGTPRLAVRLRPPRDVMEPLGKAMGSLPVRATFQTLPRLIDAYLALQRAEVEEP